MKRHDLIRHLVAGHVPLALDAGDLRVDLGVVALDVFPRRRQIGEREERVHIEELLA